MRPHTSLPKSLRPTRMSLAMYGAALLATVLGTGHLVAGAPTPGGAPAPVVTAPVAPPVVAGTTIVVAVPWNGSRAKSHVVCAGCALTLQAVASDGSGNPVSLSSGTWDPGDGSGPQVISVSNSRALELVHTYPAAAAVGTPYTATIRVVDPTANVYTDTFKVQIQPDSLGTRVNMAIDSGLWYNHKRLSLGTIGSHTSANTCDNDCQASTAATVQAFEVNGHRETGDPTLDPYVDDVGRGLRYLQNNLVRLTSGGTLPLQNGNDPDANHNGYGLYPNTGSQVYVTGQVIDAFVASGTKTATATVGTEAGRAYQDIVQDMIDAYSFGMNDASGGWVYTWNDSGGVDSSSSGWWGVGAHAAESWGLTVPSWVTSLNATVGIPNLQASNGSCGYRTAGQVVWNSGPWSDTGACLIMMSADGMARSTTRFTNGENYLASIFNNSLDHNDIYAMYNVTKAMRLAIDGSGNSTPITLMGGTIDWWGYDPHPATQGFDEGFARYLVQTQNSSTGQLAPFGAPNSGIGGSLTNSWGILILSPALFVNGPAAVCSTGASVVCEAGAAPGQGSCNTTGTDPYAAVTFSASQSVQGDFPIASYSWNLGGGTQAPPLDATNVTDTATFSTTGTHDVIVTVTDTKGNSSQATCEVSVISSALAPVASAGGPYTMCIGANSLVLDASASTGRGTNITNYDWDLQGNIDFNQIDATGVHPDVAAIFNALGLGTWNIGLRVTDDASPANHVTNFSTVTVSDCAPPVITAPANISVQTTNPGGAVVTYTAPSATDNVDGTDAVSCTSAPTAGLSSGSTFPVGTTTITCTAKDHAGNNATPKSFTVTVTLNHPPTFTPPANITVEATSPAGAVATYTATGSDQEDGPLTPVCSPVSGSTFPVGTTTVSCTVTDSGGLTASGTFLVTVQDTTPPVVTVPANITIHATSPAGAAVTFNTPALDIVDLGADAVICTPASGSTFPLGTTTVTCSATDAHHNTGSASFTVTVTNTAPVAAPATASTHGDPVTVTLSGNWSDADGDPISGPTPKIGPFKGTIAVNLDNSVTYTPFNTTHNDTDTWTYSINDGRGGSSDGTLTITIHNVAPVAVNDTASTHGAPVVISVLANDTDADSDPLAIVSGNGGAAHGSVTVNGNGTITYTPFLPFLTPTDSFPYTISDGHGGTATATVTVTLQNNPPVAQNDAVSTHSVVTIPVLANDSDADGDALTITSNPDGPTAHGQWHVNGDGTIRYTPNAGFNNGVDSFQYTINDGHGGSSTATVTVTVFNTPPVAVNDSVTLAHNQNSITIAVLANDTDAEGDPLSLASFQGLTGPGSLVNNGNGTITYTAGTGFFGPTASFTYTAKDGFGGVSNTATVTIHFTNAAPVDTPYAASTHGQPVTVNVLANATDADGDTITLLGCGVNPSPTHGVCHNNGDGTVTYSPNANWFGPTDSFGYTISDGHGGNAHSVVTITYVNTPPVPGHPSFSTFINTPLNLTEAQLTAGTTDADGDHVFIPGSGSPVAAHGTITSTGQDQGTYTPNTGFVGLDTLTYTIDDGHGGTVTGTATITVIDNIPPVVTAGPNQTIEATSPNGAVATFTSSANDNVDGPLPTTCSPASGSTFPLGTTTVTCKATDAAGNTASTTFTITVVDTTPPAVLVPASISLETVGVTGRVVTFTASATDIVDLTDAVTCSPASGSLFAIGATTVTCTSTDAHHNTGTASFVVTIWNAPPVANPDTALTLENTPVTIANVLANDTDVDGGILSVTSASATSANGGTVTQAGNVLTYTPAANFYGTDTFTYTISDGEGGSATATVTVTVSRLGRFVALSTDLTWLQGDTTVVTGDVGATSLRDKRDHDHARDHDDGDNDDVTVRVGEDVTMQQASSRVVGDTVRLSNKASIYNLVDNFTLNKYGKSTILGTTSHPMAVPFVALPVLPAITAGTTAVEVARNATVTLAPGAYGKVHVNNGATLILSGGLYQMLSLDVEQSATVIFHAATEIRIKGELDTDNKAKLILDPAVAGLKASQVVIYVGGGNDDCHHDGKDSEDGEEGGHAVAHIGENNVVQANIYAPGGTVWIKSKTVATGAFIGEDVRVGQRVTLTLDSFFKF